MLANLTSRFPKLSPCCAPPSTCTYLNCRWTFQTNSQDAASSVVKTPSEISAAHTEARQAVPQLSKKDSRSQTERQQAHSGGNWHAYTGRHHSATYHHRSLNQPNSERAAKCTACSQGVAREACLCSSLGCSSCHRVPDSRQAQEQGLVGYYTANGMWGLLLSPRTCALAQHSTTYDLPKKALITNRCTPAGSQFCNEASLHAMQFWREHYPSDIG